MIKELLRKFIHISGLIFFFGKTIIPVKDPLFWLGLLFAVNLVEVLRATGALPFLNLLFKSVLREKELSDFSGTFYYFWGIGLSFLFFPIKIAFISLWVLCVADGIAGLFGRTVMHSLIFFLISLLIATLFLHTFTPELLIKALFWTVIEKIKLIDDNLSIPLVVSISLLF